MLRNSFLGLSIMHHPTWLSRLNLSKLKVCGGFFFPPFFLRWGGVLGRGINDLGRHCILISLIIVLSAACF